MRLVSDQTATRDLRLLNDALKEMRHTFRVFAPWSQVRKVAVFGSARTPPDDPDFEQARIFAERMATAGWMAITGAGPGIMHAAQGGAGRDASFGVNIRLPFEQSANETIAGDPKLINYRYFFTRKLAFVKEAHALALFPGGFGTLDEGYEALTLIQTGKSEIVPIVFVERPGGDYWTRWNEQVRLLLERGLISETDRALYKVTDDADAAVREILSFYANYHSSRWVGQRLVLRVRHAPEVAELERINDLFSDLCAKGRIEVSDPLSAEAADHPELARVVFRANRKEVGRLRELIDHLNALVEDGASPASEASPHALVATVEPGEEDESEDELL